MHISEELIQTKTASAPIVMTQRKRVLVMYILFFGTLIFSLVTPPALAVISLLACVIVLAGIYMVRAMAKKESLLDNHATFLIRTFWRSNLYLAFTSIAGLAYMLILTDYSPLTPCMTYISNNADTVLMSWGAEQYSKLFAKCTTPFIHNNMINIVVSLFIMVFPILIYLLNRLILGWSRAIRGIPVEPDRL